MSALDILLLLVIGIAVALAIGSIRKHKGCCGDCSKCHSSCKQ